MASPPAAASTNLPAANAREKPPPTVAAIATCSVVSAVASLSSPSPPISAIRRGGRPARLPIDSAATGSGGATAAPSTAPAASDISGVTSEVSAATANVVIRTSATERLAIGRQLARIASRLDRRAALYSNGGMRSTSTRCGSSLRFGPGSAA